MLLILRLCVLSTLARDAFERPLSEKILQKRTKRAPLSFLHFPLWGNACSDAAGDRLSGRWFTKTAQQQDEGRSEQGKRRLSIKFNERRNPSTLWPGLRHFCFHP